MLFGVEEECGVIVLASGSTHLAQNPVWCKISVIGLQNTTIKQNDTPMIMGWVDRMESQDLVDCYTSHQESAIST